jgi:CheY-like chemotaxis protein
MPGPAHPLRNLSVAQALPCDSPHFRKVTAQLTSQQKVGTRATHPLPWTGTAMQTLTAAQRRPKVLIADDEPIIAKTLALILTASGFDATFALSGEAAVQAARASCPDAVVLDVYMRGISGIETASRIRALNPSCKTILISGASPEPELLAEIASLGVDVDVLIKPFDPTELLETLRNSSNSQGAPPETPVGALVSSLG